MDINEAIQLAYECYQNRDLQQAEKICRDILQIQPNNVEVYNNLGLILYEEKQFNEAINCYQKALELNPDLIDVYFNLGNVFRDKGQFDKSLYYYQKVLQYNPDSFDSYTNIGIAYQGQGLFDEAITCYQKALQLNPDNSDVFHNLGISYQKKHKLDEAIACYQEAIKLNPELDAAYNNLGCVYETKREFGEAALYYMKALQINPNASDTYCNLGNILREQGNRREALEAYNKAFASDNSNIRARWAHCMAQIPILYSDQSSIELSRKKYSEELTDLVESMPLETRSDIENAAEAVGTLTPFYLAYQGFNDRELQEVYGNLVCHIMALRYPEYANRPTMPPLLPDKSIKVGFVSSFFYRHASWYFPTKGWVENIDKKRFHLHGYYTGKYKDEETTLARQYFDRFVEDIYSLDELCEIIRNDNLHILIYPEIGMDGMTVRLAALRLAPIQCVSWGHAATSGLPTMDYFLSGEDLEPADADEHYSECLIRLPKLSIYYSPLVLPPTTMNRKTFDLASDSVLYHCCQPLLKFLPQYDDIFPRIAQQVENCTFLFIRSKSILHTEKFRSRINQAFKKFNLDYENYVVFRDHLDQEQYYAINCLADIYLDPIGWSGCNSAFAAIEANLPIVTLPSQFMIGHISSAVLTTMGIKETIAESIDEYIEIAAKLGKDTELRNYLSEQIAANKHLIYRDRTCITGLEDFFEKVVKETPQ